MVSSRALFVAIFVGLGFARPLIRREVPQEQSHKSILVTVQEFLQQDNPDNIVDPVFGLLGNAAAVEGAGNIADPDCLHQAAADRAFTNAKAAGDVEGMTAALLFRAVERNTGSVGEPSVLCSSIEAVNPEIASLVQHQDPASEGATELNREITLEVARQIASIGGDPQAAVLSGTFEPGDPNDPTGAGNTCNDENDLMGCIFTQNLLVPDVTPEEINAAVAGAGAGPDVVNSDAVNPNATNPNTVNPDVVNPDVVDPQVNATAAINSEVVGPENATTNEPATTLDLGACVNPSIEFGVGFDGRTDASFQPADRNEFNQGSAQAIGIVADFICSRLQSNCQAPDETVQECNDASLAAQNLEGQAAADAFNAALGV